MSFAIAGALVGAYAGIGGVGILAGAAMGAVGGALVGQSVTGYQAAEDAQDAQREANRIAQENADKQLAAYEQQSAAQAAESAAAARTAEQRFNAANQKRPDTRSLLDAASAAGRGGVSGTMLTGPAGVDKDKMALGRSTLLGM